MRDFIVGIVLASITLIGAFASFAYEHLNLNRTVIAHQCAHYDPQTGAFTWNTEAKP